MELIYITNKRIPTDRAHGYQIAKMCEAFSSVGLKVSLWLPQRVNTIQEDLFLYYQIKEKFSVRYIKSPDYIKYHWLGRFGFIFQTIAFSLRIFFTNIPKDSLVYTRSPEIVFICKCKGRKVIYEDHGWPKRAQLYLYCVRKANKVIAITNGVKKEYEKRGIVPEKVMVAPDGVDLDVFTPKEDKLEARKKLTLPIDKKIVTYTGSFYQYTWKGIDVLLGTEKLLPPDTVLVLVGGRDTEIATIKEKYQLERTYLFAKRPRHDVALFLKASDVLVLPNKTGDSNSVKYTSPLKLFEYMASGVPIIASALPSISEILDDTNGYLVVPDSSQKLVEKLTYVLEHTLEAQQKATQAFNDVQQYTWIQRALHIRSFISM